MRIIDWSGSPTQTCVHCVQMPDLVLQGFLPTVKGHVTATQTRD